MLKLAKHSWAKVSTLTSEILAGQVALCSNSISSSVRCNFIEFVMFLEIEIPKENVYVPSCRSRCFSCVERVLDIDTDTFTLYIHTQTQTHTYIYIIELFMKKLYDQNNVAHLTLFILLDVCHWISIMPRQKKIKSYRQAFPPVYLSQRFVFGPGCCGRKHSLYSSSFSTRFGKGYVSDYNWSWNYFPPLRVC